MAHDLMNVEQLKLWILRRLGAPTICVELTDEQLLDSIDNARRWFSAKKGVKKMGGMALISMQTVYDLPDDVDTVLDVSFSSSPFDLSSVFSPFWFPEQQIPYSVLSASGSMGLYSHVTQTLQYIETAKRVLSAEQDWRQEGRKLFIFPARSYSGTMIIDYKSGHITIEQLNERDHDLLKRYALARAMEVLGRVRSKYDAYPTAQGSVTLDGSALLDEARTLIEALDEEIAASGYPMGLLTG